MSSDLDVIKRIIDAFERSDWAEIDVRAGSLRIRLSVDGDVAADAEGSAATVATAPRRVDGAADRAENTGAPEPRRLIRSAGRRASRRLAVSGNLLAIAAAWCAAVRIRR